MAKSICVKERSAVFIVAIKYTFSGIKNSVFEYGNMIISSGLRYSSKYNNSPKILEIFSRAADWCGHNPAITLQTKIQEFGFDSLDMIEIIMEIEDEFDISIPDDEAEAFCGDKNVGDVAAYVKRVTGEIK